MKIASEAKFGCTIKINIVNLQSKSLGILCHKCYNIMRHICAFMKKVTLLAVLCLVFAFSGCSKQEKEPIYNVAVSLDNSDQWHDKMRDEILQEAVLHPELHLILKTAYGSSELQAAQIDSLAALNPDIMIVCVEDPMTLHSSIDNAYDAGIPIVINSKNPKMSKYTAYVGTDNNAVGWLMAEYLLEIAKSEHRDSKNPLRVIEILGKIGAPAVSERYVSLRDSIHGHNEVQITNSVCGDWDYDKTYRLVDSLLKAMPETDVIIAQNDIMALGAYAAGVNNFPEHNYRILGVDALSGHGNGVEAIIDGKIAASITNVSRGDMIVQTAYNILMGQPFVRDNSLQPVLVDQSSRSLIMRMMQEMSNESKVINTLQMRVDRLWEQASDLTNKNSVLIVVVVLLFALVILSVVVYKYRIKVNKERAQNALLLATQQQQLEKITAELEQVKSSQSIDDQFLACLQEEIEKHIDDSDYSVDQLSDTLGVSRAQLFRRVKALTGVTPLTMLKQVRLRKARQLLQNTDLNMQQVAYSVGYSLPSYFAKSYKEMFGVLPSEERRTNGSKNIINGNKSRRK